jgi:ABC-type phosphate transport system substrate-binding protein
MCILSRLVAAQMRVWVAGLVVVPLMGTAVRSAEGPPPFVVIVNNSNPITSLPVTELQRIFRKQTRMWRHGESMVPVDWDATSEVRREFSRLVMGRSVREMADFWIQQSMTQGLAPPSTQRSTRAILRFVASVPGAISYVPRGEADGSVKIISVNILP